MAFLDVRSKNRPPLMLLMLAWACPRMLLMLAWACRLHMSQHDCLSLSGKEFICWIKTALPDMLDQNCSRQCCSLQFVSAAMRSCSCRFITASVWARVEKLVLNLFHCNNMTVCLCVGSKPLFVTCWIKIAPPQCCSLHVLSAAMKAYSCHQNRSS